MPRRCRHRTFPTKPSRESSRWDGLFARISVQPLIVLMISRPGIRLSLDRPAPGIRKIDAGRSFRIALNGFVRQADETIRRGARQPGNELLQCRPRDQRTATSFDG
jgi:hypothetical protein